MNPSARCDTVGLVLQLAWEHLIEVLEDGLSEQLRVKSSHSVHSVRADNSQESHSDFLFISLLNDTHAAESVIISWVSLLDFLKEEEVNEVNQVKMSGE